MLKGYVFKNQTFENQIFAYFIDTFLDKKCGVGNFGNNMEVTYNGNTITIQDGLACIKGRFLGEDTYTTLEVGTDNFYCKLVIEVDLDKENTEEIFKQASYKIIKDTNNYPSLIQTDIVKNNAGIYQYELASFRTSANGITDFQDKRTFIDLDSIFSAINNKFNSFLEDLKTKIQNVEDGSAYFLKDNIHSTTVINNSEDPQSGGCTIDYPEGFNAGNTVVLSVCIGYFDTNSTWTEIVKDSSITYGKYAIEIDSKQIQYGMTIKVVLIKN